MNKNERKLIWLICFLVFAPGIVDLAFDNAKPKTHKEITASYEQSKTWKNKHQSLSILEINEDKMQ